ncbi:hypothetical protein ECDEC13C_2153, partial [Escherichia coli DEC13C]
MYCSVRLMACWMVLSLPQGNAVAFQLSANLPHFL